MSLFLYFLAAGTALIGLWALFVGLETWYWDSVEAHEADRYLRDRERRIARLTAAGEMYPEETADMEIAARASAQTHARRDGERRPPGPTIPGGRPPRSEFHSKAEQRRWVRDHMRPHGGLR